MHYESDKKNESDQCYCVFGHRVRILFSRFYMAESKYKIKVTDKFYELSLVDICAIRNNPNLLVLFETGESDLIRYSFKEFVEVANLIDEVNLLCSENNLKSESEVLIEENILKINVPVKRKLYYDNTLGEPLHSDSSSNSSVPESKTENKFKMALSLTEICAIIPTFTGKKIDYICFKKSCTRAIALCAEQQVDYVTNVIRTKLGNAGNDIPDDVTSWTDIAAAMDEKFLDYSSKDRLEHEMSKLRQESGESIQSYKNRAEKLQSQILECSKKADVLDYMRERLKSKFINGLHKDIRIVVVSQRPATIKRAFEIAQEEEMLLENSNFQQNHSREERYSNQNRPPQNHNRLHQNRPPQNHNRPQRQFPLFCSNCRQEGHMEWNCRVRRNPPPRLNQRDERQYMDESQRNQQDRPRYKQEPQHNQRVCTEKADISSYIFIGVNGERIKALIDSGSEVNMINSELLFQRQVDETKRTVLTGVGGTSVSFGQATLDVFIEEHQLNMHFKVVDEKVLGEFGAFLGCNFLKACKANLDFNTNKLITESFSVDLLSDYIQIDPRSHVQRSIVIKEKNSSIFIDGFDNDGVILPDCVIKSDECGRSQIIIANTSDSVKICNVRTLSGNKFDEEILPVVSLSKPLEIRDNHMNFEEKASINKILEDYKDVFGELDPTNITSAGYHEINTIPGAKPTNVKLYRYPKVHEEEVNKQLKELLEKDVIEESNSPWTSPIWVVPKKLDASGKTKWRIVCDFRNLNQITVSDSYPLPNIAEILDQLGKSKYFSILDLTSGFHQIPIKKEDQWKTGFSTPYNHYHFKMMPFGLKNAPACFQRIMNTVLRGLQGSKCFVYLDDIVLYGDTLDQHNERLIEVLSRLKKNNLKVQIDKCEFLRKEVSYLGHIITENGVRMDPKKMEAVDNLNIPKNPKEVKSLMGMMGYYRRFIKNFGIISAPINNLLKKTTVFKWSEECDKAFNTLKQKLTEDITLKYPDFDKQFILTTDASSYGIGAVLSQLDDNGFEKPILFLSRQLNKAEKNYSTTEQECLAIVWAVKNCRHYLLGRKFIIKTDHQPLTWLFNVNDPGSRLVRWRLKLEEYDYEIQYKKGKTNVVADELSRNVRMMLRNKKILNPPQSREPVQEDIQVIQEEPSPETLADNHDMYNLPTLYEENENFNSENLILSSPIDEDVDDNLLEEEIDSSSAENIENCNQIAIPSTSIDNRVQLSDDETIKNLIHEQHCGPIGGHRGITAMENFLKKRFIIPNLRKRLEDYIGCCESCQLNKYDRQNRRLPMQLTPTSSTSNEQIFFDVIGPFKYGTIKKYGLTIQDNLTKYTRFCGIANTKAHTIARALIDQWITIFGIPKTMISDNGTNLCGKIMQNVASYFGIKHITTSVAHPQTNGAVERAHARLAEFMRTTSEELKNCPKWEMRMKLASYCYNTTPHSAIGCSPHELMFGTTPRLISQIDFSPDEDNSYSNYLATFQSEMKTIWKKTQDKINANKQKIINNNNAKVKRRKITEFKVGQQVYVQTKTFFGAQNRVIKTWTGPYKILEVTPHNLVIQKARARCTINKCNAKLVL